MLFLDDWDDLDESSWGVAEAVRRATGLPIVLSRLQGLRARHTPSGLHASTLEPTFVIEMVPIRFEELEQVISGHLAGQIEKSTISRLYAKSGGIVGLALSLVDAGVREGRLRESDGVWVATRDMWSPGLRGVVEAHLENLGSDARDALEIIALVGVADIETVRKLVSWDTLELLEERAMVKLVPSGNRHLVTVVPPLLVEFFRHEPVAARRIRLTELILERLGAAESMGVLLASAAPDDENVGESDALFVRLLQERARTRRIVTKAEWEQSPTPSTATTYIRALMHAPEARGLIAEVFESTDSSLGDEASRVEYLILRAQWGAFVDGTLDAALSSLASATRDLGVHRRAADAASVIVETSLRAVPSDFADRLEITDDLPEAVRVRLLEAQMFVLITLGRFGDASRVFLSIGEKEKNAVGFAPNVLYGLVLLGLGDHAGAVSWSLRGVDEAHGFLDVDAVRAHGAVAALCLTIEGDYAGTESILNTMFAAGDAPPHLQGSQLTLLNIASLVAIRRGNMALGEKYARDLAELPIADGPLPGQARAWSIAQDVAFNGDLAAAARILWDSAEELWERGARFAAVLAYMTNVEMLPDAERLATTRERAALIDDAYIKPHLDFLTARFENDPAGLIANVPALLETGRPGLALISLRRAAELYQESGEYDRSVATEAEHDQVLKELGDRGIDTTRFQATAINLTDRELEIARYVGQGLTNPEIATRLVLSVRTVESHMHRIMRKTNVANRRELIRNLESFAR
ncbi:helix-turn-helix transcriptional regulator [Microterricola gilva]|uniref:helix-turn-helix transcriptional regulator n=1 Tax=Microterricola gilva TaxID=393267 RepID=UPI0013EEA136|nr:LuxR C-terminal-related transcriptional regulator [Microterricola gilva]